MGRRDLPDVDRDRACADRAFRRAFPADLGRDRHDRDGLSYHRRWGYAGDRARFEILRIRMRGMRTPFRSQGVGVCQRHTRMFDAAFEMPAVRKTELVQKIFQVIVKR